MELLERLKEQGVRRPVASGLGSLDLLMDGGFRPGLHTLGGQPGAGKTSFGTQLMLQMAATMPAIYFSAEPTVEELLSRLLAAESRCQLRSLLDGKPNAIAKAFEAVDRLPLGSVYVLRDDRAAGGSVAGLGRVVSQVADHHGEAPFVAVDYLQKLDPGPSGERDEKRVAVSRCSAALATLVRDRDLTALVISSLNRASYKAAPSLDAFKESGDIEFDADVAMVLRAPPDDDKYSDTQRLPVGQELRELWIVKHRFGPVSTTPLSLVFDGRFGSFQSVEP